MDYKVENIIDENDRVNLISLYKSLKQRKAYQDYNLFQLDKRLIGSEHFEAGPFQKLRKYADKQVYSHYFLMYEEGAFTKMHTDNDDEIGLTIVTLLDEVDLVGGETIVHLPYQKKQKQDDQYIKGDMMDGQRAVPKIVPVEKGQSMVYDRSLLHGVCQVEQGKRLVLVSWYYADERAERIGVAHRVAKK